MNITCTSPKYLFGFIFMLLVQTVLYSQAEDQWFFFRAKDTLFNPQFDTTGDYLTYTGSDNGLRKVLEEYKISTFKKTYRGAKKEDLKKTFFVIADSPELLNDLLRKARHLFDFGELVTEQDKKIFEPNDYGLTSTIGENIGLQVNLDNYDFLGLPQAWYYTTGSKDIFIGMSDGLLDTTSVEFKGKTKQIRKSSFSNGHGVGQAAKAAGQGDNGYGVPGVCYDCSLYGTNYGDFKYFEEVKELAVLGAKVINCSWIGRTYYESGQQAINDMFEKGTVIVASAGNKGWDETKGELLYYPASYKNVISVSTVMYKHENALDNIQIGKTGKYYAENIRGTVGRTMGFKDNDTLKAPHIYYVSTATLNTEVDILAPTTGIFLLEKYIMSGEFLYHKYQTTSGAAPFVSGTIGLMFSLAPCLPVDEVESILKMTATNIDHIEANEPFKGMYGAGMLNSGKAVKMVHDLFSENETVFIENQNFSRWDFKLTSYSDKVVIRNQEFSKNTTLNLRAKNKIVIAPNTVLRPNDSGRIHLKIDPSLTKECELRLRKEK
ncbi:S8 family peptidase [Rasiella sp. SM2506]|uniref:S8 family peptidase n=1 Tax=Rasiella sp. SM2506 TaxID=3423914 RepID=UPI003D7A2B44